MNCNRVQEVGRHVGRPLYRQTGWIYGNETERNWTQVIYKRKERFYNPVRQNKTHIRALEQLLQECSDLNLQSIIVFNDRTTFKQVRTQTPVIHPRELLSMIRSYTVHAVSAENLTKARELINGANIVDKKIREQHAKRAGTRKAKGYGGNRS
ncbi:nuclease-related domain-containing protein [Alicyclobacillus sp. SO9]|uniref:nuclease-related domain-containing protein n=1 Tax=Alicyclobacillus sp. SO9 TaxID=2665646 RepID=UPI0018E8B564|nr:nuclease-related domain-containing protein [Alicyclobacillus sp. SO9]QQE77298.1 NERD domain-containing protein [Alicyclobacillus sp. SO9]